MQNLSQRMGWDLTGTQILWVRSISRTSPYAAGGQPTPDWQYSQDLFLRTRVFYDSFRGFAYPAVARNSLTYSHFLQHTYGAIMGTTVPYSGLSTENPTIYGDNSGVATNGLKSYPNTSSSSVNRS